MTTDRLESKKDFHRNPELQNEVFLLLFISIAHLLDYAKIRKRPL